ncbi:MAG TPA: peptide deformylase [bacterium]|jgi:peptide deformylase|nr:peptide deformylase [Dictyoglomota bacterium]HHV80424.1 peptide deformylase [bacterium]HOK29361.1 peptide deformylase [bacterium]HOL54714.1 peptide deformylase [bacterium]HON72129.1 peptide deformylase [bacterium]
MSGLAIRIYGDPVLRQKALPIKNIDRRVRRLAKYMEEAMDKANGVGLAAPQVGVSERIIVVKVKSPIVLVNPVITYMEGEDLAEEGCLSLPNVVGDVGRATRVVVKGLDLNEREIEVEAKNLLARAFQHEIDHLDGILFIDRAVSIRRVEESSD